MAAVAVIKNGLDGAASTRSVPLPKVVQEYPLPASSQTHEIAAVADDMLVITQQPSSTLVKVQLSSDTGRPSAVAQFTVGGSGWAGLHGLYASKKYPGQVWATVQFTSTLLRLDPVTSDLNTAPVIMQTIPLPTSVWGPHVVIEHGDNLWTTCKGSGHVVRINHTKTSDISIYECSRRPIFVAVHPSSGDVYASLDESSKIFRLHDGTTSEIDIPSDKGTTPVGLVAGPDQNVWFGLVGGSAGGTGTFARISKDGEIDWFRLPSSTPGATAGLIHLAFDSTWQNRIWLLSSSLVSHSSIDAIFTVYLQGDPIRIQRVDTMYLTTPYCATHRVLPHLGGLFVTELEVSILAHITGSAIAAALPSESSDSYSLWGLGIPSSSYSYSTDQASSSPVESLTSASKRTRYQ